MKVLIKIWRVRAPKVELNQSEMALTTICTDMVIRWPVIAADQAKTQSSTASRLTSKECLEHRTICGSGTMKRQPLSRWRVSTKEPSLVEGFQCLNKPRLKRKRPSKAGTSLKSSMIGSLTIILRPTSTLRLSINVNSMLRHLINSSGIARASLKTITRGLSLKTLRLLLNHLTSDGQHSNSLFIQYKLK